MAKIQPEPEVTTPAAPAPGVAIVDTWGSDLLHNLGPMIPTEAYNHLHAAIQDLKARLATTPKEG